MSQLRPIAVVEAADGKPYPVLEREPGKVLVYIATDLGGLIVHGNDVEGTCSAATAGPKQEKLTMRATSDSGGVEVEITIHRNLNGKLNTPEAEEEGPRGYFVLS